MIDNWGSTIFNILYLSIIWVVLIIVAIQNKGKDKSKEWELGFKAFFLLAFGDMFHLVSRTVIFFLSLNYPEGQEAYYNTPGVVFWIGFGLAMTGFTAHLFYMAMYYYWRVGEVRKRAVLRNITEEKSDESFLYLDLVVAVSTILRAALIAYPQNKWGLPAEDANLFRWLTNVPLYVIGILVIVLFFKRASDPVKDIQGFSDVDKKVAKQSAIWIVISYVCYSMTVFLSWLNPYFGMAMIPKTIAYLAVLFIFYKYVFKPGKSE